MSDQSFHMNVALSKYGSALAVIMALSCIVTFICAIFALPITGSNCPADWQCATFPYTEIGLRYPIDFAWMYPAMGLCVATYLTFLAVFMRLDKVERLLGTVMLSFVALSSFILLVTYFVQVTVVPAALQMGRTDGLLMVSQYNPHGVFIALEDAGYLVLGLGLGVLWPIFRRGNKLEKWIGRVGGICLVATIAALIYYSITFGLLRGYRFEVAAIVINWLGLIILGPLFWIWFRKDQAA